MILFFNLPVIVFTDLAFGKSIIIVCAIVTNLIGLLRLPKIGKGSATLGLLFIIVFARQMTEVFSIHPTYVETFLPCLYFLYIASLAHHLKNSPTLVLVVGIRTYIWANFLFGLLDLLGIYYPFHEGPNISERFRGLASEPNLIAIPLCLLIISYFRTSLSIKITRIEAVLMLGMVLFSTSKIAIILLLGYFIATNILQITSKGWIKIFIFICILFSVTLLPGKMYAGWPIYNGFIKYLDISFILQFNFEAYINVLIESNQFLAGSMTTRLITSYGSIYFLYLEPIWLIWGVGGGNSYIYLIQVLGDLNLFNYELLLHLDNYPPFVSDKTFALKFIFEFGFVAYLLLITGLFLLQKRNSERSFLTYSLRTTFVFLTCQSVFLPILIIIYDRLKYDD